MKDYCQISYDLLSVSVCLSLSLFPRGFREIKGIEHHTPWLVVRGEVFWVCFFLFCPISCLLVLSSIFDAFKILLKLLRSFCPKGGRALLVSPPLSEISGLSFDSIFLSALLLFFLVLLLLLSSSFSAVRPVSCLLFRNVFNFFFYI